MSAATYKIIDDNGLMVRNENTNRVGEIFHLFGVEDLRSCLSRTLRHDIVQNREFRTKQF